MFLIGSPPCTAYSPLRNLSKNKRDPSIVAAELQAAKVHLDCCMKIYKIQIREGRSFIHEHPHNSASWAEGNVKKIMTMEGIQMASVDMCAYGMRVDTGAHQGPAHKRTKIVSNFSEVIKRAGIKVQ